MDGGDSVLDAQVYLIRHGETAWSVTGQHTSRTDLPLTERGERQARGVGELLRGMTFAQVLVSPMRRARRTCELAGLGAVARVDPNLSEWDYGAYEGRTAAEIRAERPGWDIYRDGCPGGESAEQVSNRVDKTLAVLRQDEGQVAIFSHGQFLRALAVRWIDLPIRQGSHFALDTGSLSILGHEHNNIETPAISRWNVPSNDLLERAPRRLG